MSWASILTKHVNTKSIKKPKILVKYNILPGCSIDESTDNIPRHKERTPDPADDFIMTNKYQGLKEERNHIMDHWPNWKYGDGWVDYTKDKHLKQFKQTLPLSIQRIIEFANNLSYGKVNKLNFTEMEIDLQLQYWKCNGNPKLLKKMYFNYNAQSNRSFWDYDFIKTEDYDKRLAMMYGVYNGTLIHYIFEQLEFNTWTFRHQPQLSDPNKVKVIKQLLKYLKLLIVNDILNVDDLYYASTRDITVWEKIKELAHTQNHKQYSSDIMDDIADLIISCNKQEAILNIINRKVVYSDDYVGGRYFRDWLHLRNFAQPECEHQGSMANGHDIIERLLFRGVLPFRFVHKRVTYYSERKSDTDYTHHEPTTTNTMTKDYIQSFITDAKIDQNILDKEVISDHHTYDFYKAAESQRPEKQMILLSPLILLSHNKRAKNMMVSLLSATIVSHTQSESLSEQLAKIIALYLLVDISEFYNIENIEINVNSKSIVCLSSLWQLKSDERFLSEFDKRYLDHKEVLQHIKENYWYCFMYLTRYQWNGQYRILIQFIKNYNKHNSLPLNCGIYTIFSWLIDDCRRMKPDDVHEQIVDFLKYCKSFYGREFDINSTKIIQRLVSRKEHTKLIKFILEEFRDEYDRNNPCLLFRSFEDAEYNLFEILVKLHPDEYGLKVICETLKKMQEYRVISITRRTMGHVWKEHRHERNREFLNKLQKYCLESMCETNEEKQMLTKCVIGSWKKYANDLKKEY